MIKAEWTNKDSLDLQPTCNQLATTDGDLISRADAIEAIPDTRADMFENCRNCKLLDREQVIDILSALPSAETHEIHTETHECVKNTHDTDLISREEVCEAIERYERHFNTKLETLKDLVAELPNYCADRPTRGRKDATEEDYHYCNDCEAVEMCMWYPYDGCIFKIQDRPTGKWVDNGIPDSILSKCSNCGYTAGAFSMNYCPNCGARMKGGND